MEIKDFEPYFDPEELKKRVIVKLKDGQEFVGVICGFEEADESSSGNDEIEMIARKFYPEYSYEILSGVLDLGHLLGLEIPDIESVQLVAPIE